MGRRHTEIVERLKGDHARVVAIVHRLEPFLSGESYPVEREFAQLRWSLVRELTQHHAVERAVLHRAAGPGAALSEYDQGLTTAFKDHMLRWTGAAIQDQWPSYSRAARTLLTRLRRQIQHEESALFPNLS